MPAFESEFRIFVDAMNEDASRRIAAAAHEGQQEISAEAVARRGVAPGVTSAVDGVRGGDFEAVKPEGQIVLLFDYRAEMVAMAFEELRARSPVVSGAYRDNHFCMLDGVGLPPLTVPNPAQLENVSQITITNPMPYARKLEFGKTKSGRSFNKDGNYIYTGVDTILRREFSNAAKFRFTTVNLEGAYVRKTSVGLVSAKLNRRSSIYRAFQEGKITAPEGRLTRSRRKDRVAGSVITYPAIVIDRV